MVNEIITKFEQHSKESERSDSTGALAAYRLPPELGQQAKTDTSGANLPQIELLASAQNGKSCGKSINSWNPFDSEAREHDKKVFECETKELQQLDHKLGKQINQMYKKDGAYIRELDKKYPDKPKSHQADPEAVNAAHKAEKLIHDWGWNGVTQAKAAEILNNAPHRVEAAKAFNRDHIGTASLGGEVCKLTAQTLHGEVKIVEQDCEQKR